MVQYPVLFPRRVDTVPPVFRRGFNRLEMVLTGCLPQRPGGFVRIIRIWVQVDFGTNRTLTEIDVFTLQDNYAGSSEPTESMTFTQWGLPAMKCSTGPAATGSRYRAAV